MNFIKTDINRAIAWAMGEPESPTLDYLGNAEQLRRFLDWSEMRLTTEQRKLVSDLEPMYGKAVASISALRLMDRWTLKEVADSRPSAQAVRNDGRLKAVFRLPVPQVHSILERDCLRAGSNVEVSLSPVRFEDSDCTLAVGRAQAVMFLIGAVAAEGEAELLKVEQD